MTLHLSVPTDNSFKLPVVEIFGPTVQGEGRMIGRVTHFVRLGGCGYRCSWCDSMHAVDPEQIKKNARWITPEEILAELGKLPRANWITISGGDPLMWGERTRRLVEVLQARGYRVAVETQGQFFHSWLPMLDLVTISPKPPSSGMLSRFDLDVFKTYVRYIPMGSLAVKVVVFNANDLLWAKALHKRFPKLWFGLSAGTPQGSGSTLRMRMDIIASLARLTDAVLKDPALCGCVVLPQMHALIWGAEKGR